jgi:hypothetical protein
VEGARAGDEGHGNEVDAVLNGRNLDGHGLAANPTLDWSCTHDQVAGKNLQDLGLQTLAALEDFLERADQDVAQGRTDKSAVDGHLGDARGEVVARLAPVMGNPRGKELLQAGEGTRGEHLGAQWVALQLLEVGLGRRQSAGCLTKRVLERETHCEVAIGAATFGDGLPDLVHQVFIALGGRVDRCGRRVDSFLLKLDRHGGSMGCDGSEVQMGA